MLCPDAAGTQMEHKRSPIKVSQHKERGGKTERGEKSPSQREYKQLTHSTNRVKGRKRKVMREKRPEVRTNQPRPDSGTTSKSWQG